MDKYLKVKKKLRNLVVSKPEHHNLWRKTEIKTKCELSRKKKDSLNADTKLQVDKTKRKMEEKFNKPFLSNFFNNKIKFFKSQNDQKLSSNQLDKLF